MSKILVMLETERQAGNLTIGRHSREVVAAAQQIACDELHLGLVGYELDTVIASMSRWQATCVHYLDDGKLTLYQYESMVAVAQQLVNHLRPSLVLFPHSYQCRDYAPRLACRFSRSVLTDIIGIENHAQVLQLQRPMFQARALSTIELPKDDLAFVSLQRGCWNAEGVIEGDAVLKSVPMSPDWIVKEVATQTEEPIRETARNNPLPQAKRILSVGRGIGSVENVARLKNLANHLRAEMGASRPVCDEGWLPTSVQVGSSGQTVAPEEYLAFGISGAIQHLIGMKGSRKVIAVNTDKNAPIFAIADVGIVADLMELTDALLAELQGD